MSLLQMNTLKHTTKIVGLPFFLRHKLKLVSKCCVFKVRKIVIIFLPISLNICFGCSKETSRRDSSFEYPQHMFWLRNKKNNFLVHTHIEA